MTTSISAPSQTGLEQNINALLATLNAEELEYLTVCLRRNEHHGATVFFHYMTDAGRPVTSGIWKEIWEEVAGNHPAMKPDEVWMFSFELAHEQLLQRTAPIQPQFMPEQQRPATSTLTHGRGI